MKRCKITLADIRLTADGMPIGLSLVGSTLIFLSATTYVVCCSVAILSLSCMTSEKKEAKIPGLMKVVVFSAFGILCVMMPVWCKCLRIQVCCLLRLICAGLEGCSVFGWGWSGVFVDFLAVLVTLLLFSGSGKLRDSGYSCLQMSMFESFIKATGRLELRRVLTMLKLLFSIAICAEQETSGGDVCCSLGGLLTIILVI